MACGRTSAHAGGDSAAAGSHEPRNGLADLLLPCPSPSARCIPVARLATILAACCKPDPLDRLFVSVSSHEALHWV